MLVPSLVMRMVLSLSARRAWIEIMDDLEPSKTRRVALRKESVDRNSENPVICIDKVPSLSARRAWIEIGTAWVQEFPKLVALRKESVDRNICAKANRTELNVALRKESVDRNLNLTCNGILRLVSLSARRAWIEILRPILAR